MKQEILRNLRIHYPELTTCGPFPYMWEMISPEEFVQKKEISLIEYNLYTDLAALTEKMADLQGKNEVFELTTSSNNCVILTQFVLEDILKTTERVANLLREYLTPWGFKLKDNPHYLAAGFTPSELCEVVKDEGVYGLEATHDGKIETFDEFRNRVLKLIHSKKETKDILTSPKENLQS